MARQCGSGQAVRKATQLKVESLALAYRRIKNWLENRMPGMFFVTPDRWIGSVPEGFLKAIFACIP
jgi:hypothetical protein